LPYEIKELMDATLAREGLRRLKPLRRLAANLSPDPGSDVGRVSALEAAHYLRNSCCAMPIGPAWPTVSRSACR